MGNQRINNILLGSGITILIVGHIVMLQTKIPDFPSGQMIEHFLTNMFAVFAIAKGIKRDIEIDNMQFMKMNRRENLMELLAIAAIFTVFLTHIFIPFTSLPFGGLPIDSQNLHAMVNLLAGVIIIIFVLFEQK